MNLLSPVQSIFKSLKGRHHKKFLKKCAPLVNKINEIENKLDDLAVESCEENTSLEDLIYEIQIQVGALKDFIK